MVHFLATEGLINSLDIDLIYTFKFKKLHRIFILVKNTYLEKHLKRQSGFPSSFMKLL